MKSQLKISYKEIISPENLLAAWQEFVCGKRSKKDVQQFSLNLADNILQLNSELANFTYKHGEYTAFNISDPKPRNIHKAGVRDRVLHHAIYRKLYPFFDKTFIADSYSCRVAKGTHKAMNRFESFGRQVSKNNTKTVWVLKCDIRKFFASIDHKVLLGILASHISDKGLMWLINGVIESFSSSAPIYGQQRQPINRRTTQSDIGLPLGNLTSQLFCNIYMNEFDQFVKHKLKAKYYIRYADDFVFLSEDRSKLLSIIPKISTFLGQSLKLQLHPDKVFVKTLASGVDFLGWVNFPYYRTLRNTTSRRMFKRLKEHPEDAILQSYLGLIKHGNSHKLKLELLNWQGLWMDKV
jgi:RNA-directed DNA polymerase